jgi:uncharacterized protein
MRIELENLQSGRGSFAHVYQPEELNPVDERVLISGPVTFSGNVRVAGTEVFLDGNIEAQVEVECDRCLKPVSVVVRPEFSLEYMSEGDYESTGVAELTEDLMAVSVFDGESIDVDEVVKEQLLLAVPSRTLCTEECKGICPGCGVNRNAVECNCEQSEIDPRWAALKDLRDGKS